MRKNLNGVAVIFDLDGTLIDTAPDLAGAMNAVLKAAGRDTLPVETVRYLVGDGARALIKKGFSETGAPVREEAMEDHVAYFLEYYSQNIAIASRAFPHLEDCLTQLSDAGAALAVCTNKPEHLARRLLTELEMLNLFDALIGGDTLPVKKPEPEPLFEAARRAGAAPETGVMVGDAPPDAGAAKAAKYPLILMRHGYGKAIDSLEADFYAESFKDVADAVFDLAPAGKQDRS